MKILILASNPRKELNLDREIRDLKRAIENSRNREEFEVVDELAVRVGDLQELLHKHRPQIVHFCGHGSGKQGLVFESDMGREHWVSTDALSNLFRLFSSRVECVLLNACYSEEQAGAIVDHINYVIGMNQEIRDDAAIAFSKGFYRALGYACSIEQSYEFGCNAIQLEISGSSVVRSTMSETERKLGVADAVAKIAIPEHQKPILKKKPTLTSNLSANIPSPNQTLSQEKRTEIQLDIDTSLKANSKVKQYRDRVREFLGDRKLTEFEKIRLDRLQKSLSLSDEEARQILAEEQALLQEPRDEYKEMVIQLIEKGQYPFNAQTEQELGQMRQELQLTDEEVNEISRPIIEKAEAEYQAVLAQQKYNLGNTLKNPGKLEEAITAYRKTEPGLMKKILILATNPQGTSRLRLDEEMRAIEESLWRSDGNLFQIEHRWASRLRDVQRSLLDINPSIVHFSGHGTGDEGLVFEDEVGSRKLVDGEALAGLFELFAEQLECVVLNGCYSEVQAEAIRQHINYVIGLKKAIGYKVAIDFAVGFYEALGAGRSVEFAHKLGCAAVRLAGIPEQLTPALKKKPNIGETVAQKSWPEEQANLSKDAIKEQPDGQEKTNQTQTNTVRDVSVGGNFEFKPIQEGKKS
jgi:tetratricopeptide (TPR) repeat protein